MAIIKISTYRSITKSLYNKNEQITLADFLSKVYDDERIYGFLNKYDINYLS